MSLKQIFLVECNQRQLRRANIEKGLYETKEETPIKCDLSKSGQMGGDTSALLRPISFQFRGCQRVVATASRETCHCQLKWSTEFSWRCPLLFYHFPFTWTLNLIWSNHSNVAPSRDS